MSKFAWGLIYWWALWIGVGFLAPELLAHFWARCPWPTLSRTTWDVEHDWEPFRLLLVLFLAVLCAHLVWKLSAGALIAVVVAGAIAALAHLFVSY